MSLRHAPLVIEEGYEGLERRRVVDELLILTLAACERREHCDRVLARIGRLASQHVHEPWDGAHIAHLYLALGGRGKIPQRARSGLLRVG